MDYGILKWYSPNYVGGDMVTDGNFLYITNSELILNASETSDRNYILKYNLHEADFFFPLIH